MPSGAAGDFAANAPDRLIDLVHALRAPYRQGAAFVMNASTLARIRKFKTADGAFLWQPSMAAGSPATLLGYPVIEAEDMPDVAANTLSIAFGNFKAGYLIAERQETVILRDPYSNKPFVHFYATAALDIAVQPVVEAVGVDVPPVSPAPGQCWIVGAAPSGAWAGWTAWVVASGLVARYDGTLWSEGVLTAARIEIGGVRVVAAQQAAIENPVGGAIIDSEARVALSAIINSLSLHGLIAP